MIEGNVLKFGYGDILCYFDTFGFLCFTPSNKTYDVNTIIDRNNIDEFEYDKKVFVKIEDLTSLSKFKEKLNLVKTTNNKTFDFEGYIFDFNNYNEKSVDIVLEKLKELVYSDWILRFAA